MNSPQVESKYRVERYDSALRFLVTSYSRDGVKHLVELNEFNNNGACTCEHFKYRCQPELEKGAPAGPRYRCNHILQAREFCLNTILADVAASVQQQRTAQQQPPSNQKYARPPTT